MKVILLDNVAKIGQKFEVKNVADGYALNFLIPQGLAKTATNNVIKEVEMARESYETKRKEEEENLIKNIKELKDSTINIYTKINKDGGLFKGIDKKEIISAIKDQKALEINPENIILDKPIKKAVEQIITIKADGETVEFKLKIVEGEE